MIGDITERFKILGLETAEEYIAKKKIEEEELRRETEAKGICDFCGWDEGDEPHLRWINGDTYICQECFDSDLKEALSHQVPSINFEETSACIGECEWNDLAKEERQVT